MPRRDDSDDDLTYIDRMEYVGRRRKRLSTQWDTICIYIDGANNGRSDTRAAVAVYFGYGGL